MTLNYRIRRRNFVVYDVKFTAALNPVQIYEPTRTAEKEPVFLIRFYSDEWNGTHFDLLKPITPKRIDASRMMNVHVKNQWYINKSNVFNDERKSKIARNAGFQNVARYQTAMLDFDQNEEATLFITAEPPSEENEYHLEMEEPNARETKKQRKN